MDVDLDFDSVLRELGQHHKHKNGNYTCPFCHKKSFKPYPNGRAKCHNEHCEWYGDIAQLYADIKGISRNEAFTELGIALKEKRIGVAPNLQTYDEAKSALAKDLEYLRWVKMYMAFYDTKISQKMIADRTGTSEAEVSKILKGRVGNPSSWRKVIVGLKSFIPMEQFKKDLALKEKYFERLLDDEKLGLMVKKYQIKPQRAASVKKKKQE